MNDSSPLREQLRKHIQQDSLSAGELAELDKLMRSRPALAARKKRSVGVGLSVALGVLLLWLIGPFSLPLGSGNPNVNFIVEEVATNHVRIKSLDVTTDSIDKLRNQLDQLDFAPAWPERLGADRYRLVGGRYCTLRGAIATQMFLRDTADNHVTLYETAYNRNRFGALPHVDRGEPPIIREQGGVSVWLWVETGLVMALAVDAQAQHSGVYSVAAVVH